MYINFSHIDHLIGNDRHKEPNFAVMSFVLDLAKNMTTMKKFIYMYQQLPFRYRLKLYALFINGKMRLPFIDSDLL
jgi:hypothetical protein